MSPEDIACLEANLAESRARYDALLHEHVRGMDDANDLRAQLQTLTLERDDHRDHATDFAADCARLQAERDALRDRLRDHEDGIRAVLAEDCAPDEKHCSCVPTLRGRIAELERAWTEAQEIMGMADVGLTAAGLRATACDVLKERNEDAAEVARLEAQVERLTAERDEALVSLGGLVETDAKRLAQVRRHHDDADAAHVRELAAVARAEQAEALLRDTVERLRRIRANDGMDASRLRMCIESIDAAIGHAQKTAETAHVEVTRAGAAHDEGEP